MLSLKMSQFLTLLLVFLTIEGEKAAKWVNKPNAHNKRSSMRQAPMPRLRDACKITLIRSAGVDKWEGTLSKELKFFLKSLSLYDK